MDPTQAGSSVSARDHAQRYLQDLQRIIEAVRPAVESELGDMADAIAATAEQGSTIYTMGNGGSAAAAAHLTNDLNKYPIQEEEFPRLRSVSLVDNTPVVLAWANDESYDEIFVEQLKNHLDPDDIVIGISGSGDSENCVRALEYANSVGATTISWTGFGGGRMAPLSDISVVIPTDSMVRCEDLHVIIHHCLVSFLQEKLGGSGGERSVGTGNRD